MRTRSAEILTGLLVIAAAAAFVVFAFTRNTTNTVTGYPLTAQFGSVGSLSVGSAVKIAGVTVGHVSAITLNPTSYEAIVKFAVDPKLQVPRDSSAAIESASLLGGDYLSISPGGSTTMLQSNQAIKVTQSAINIESLLGKFVFSAANLASSTKKAGATAPAATKPAAAPSTGLSAGLKP